MGSTLRGRSSPSTICRKHHQHRKTRCLQRQPSGDNSQQDHSQHKQINIWNDFNRPQDGDHHKIVFRNQQNSLYSRCSRKRLNDFQQTSIIRFGIAQHDRTDIQKACRIFYQVFRQQYVLRKKHTKQSIVQQRFEL